MVYGKLLVVAMLVAGVVSGMGENWIEVVSTSAGDGIKLWVDLYNENATEPISNNGAITFNIYDGRGTVPIYTHTITHNSSSVLDGLGEKWRIEPPRISYDEMHLREKLTSKYPWITIEAIYKDNKHNKTYHSKTSQYVTL